MMALNTHRTALSMPEEVRQALASRPVFPKAITDQYRDAVLAFVQRVARAWWGECLSSTYVQAHMPLDFRCQVGHHFQKKFVHIRNGSWCGRCYHDARRHGLEKVQQYCAVQGGVCLSNEYVNTLTKMDFRCREGHQFSRCFREIESGKWCQKCHRIAEELKLWKKSIYPTDAPSYGSPLMLARQGK